MTLVPRLWREEVHHKCYCWVQNERCHNEIGAPDSRIDRPIGLVLTPWDEDL
jgi:hypothetical protein